MCFVRLSFSGSSVSSNLHFATGFVALRFSRISHRPRPEVLPFASPNLQYGSLLVQKVGRCRH